MGSTGIAPRIMEECSTNDMSILGRRSYNQFKTTFISCQISDVSVGNYLWRNGRSDTLLLAQIAGPSTAIVTLLRTAHDAAAQAVEAEI